MKIIDISIPLYRGMATYPNNPEFSITEKRSATSLISRISMGTHSGTHIDAPKHVFLKGSVDGMDLNSFYGACRVLDMTRAKKVIELRDLATAKIKKGERILLKTANSKRGYQKFYSDFVSLSGDAADYIANKGVRLVGIDSLSIKQKGSGDARAHTALLKKGIAVLEGINLNKVKPGKYILCAFPLKIIDADGAPTRAVLMTL